MKISFENPDKINGLLTLVVEEEDYKNDVEKTLKDYRKKANVPGFRPGQAPMGMILICLFSVYLCFLLCFILHGESSA